MLFEIERDFGGLCFGEWLFGTDELTVWKLTDDVRVFAKNDAALKTAVAALRFSDP